MASSRHPLPHSSGCASCRQLKRWNFKGLPEPCLFSNGAAVPGVSFGSKSPSNCRWSCSKEVAGCGGGSSESHGVLAEIPLNDATSFFHRRCARSPFRARRPQFCLVLEFSSIPCGACIKTAWDFSGGGWSNFGGHVGEASANASSIGYGQRAKPPFPIGLRPLSSSCCTILRCCVCAPFWQPKTVVKA